MRSKKNKTHHQSRISQKELVGIRLTHQPLSTTIVFTLVMWFLFRSIFMFPVWFDEIVGKAVFFGLPVWIYVNLTGFRPIIDTFRLYKLKAGLLRGLAFGGIFGFVVLFIRLVEHQWSFLFFPLYFSNIFWWEFLLALFTAFWETLFFYSFITRVIFARFKHWSLPKQITLSTMIFLLFHIPNIFLRFEAEAILSALFILTLFAIGQTLIFKKDYNAYTLVLTHAIWGMVLLFFV